jgi:hypothetical protein
MRKVNELIVDAVSTLLLTLSLILSLTLLLTLMTYRVDGKESAAVQARNVVSVYGAWTGASSAKEKT